MTDLSIIIVSYKTRELLDKCLASIFGAPPALAFEVIVVDNASGDGTVEMVREKYPAAALMASGVNLGFSAGNNIAIRRAAGRNVLLLNPDTEVTAAALEAMSSFLDTHPETGAAGVQLLNSDGSLQESFFNIPMPLSRKLERMAFYPRLAAALLRLPPAGPPADTPGARRVDIVKGACMMVPRRALDRVGLLDEDSFLYADDIDWCMRARRLGLGSYILENHTITHHGWASTDQEVYLTIVSSRRSALLLYRKHYPRPVAALWSAFIYGEIIYKYALNALRVRLGRANEKTRDRHRAYKELFLKTVLGRN